MYLNPADHSSVLFHVIIPVILVLVGLYYCFRFFQSKRRNRKNLIDRKTARDNGSSSNMNKFQFSVLSNITSNHRSTETFQTISILAFVTAIIIFEITSSFDKALYDMKFMQLDDFLTKGKFGYEIQDTMEMSNNYFCIATITKSSRDSILFSGLHSSEFVKLGVNVSSRVKVNLIDPTGTNFTITSLNTEEQLVDDSSNTVWEWNVSPIQVGSNKLILKASAKIRDGLGDSYRDIPILKRTVFVRATFVQSVGHFISKYWIYITFGLTVILLPFWKWILNKFKKWREQRKNNQRPAGFQTGTKKPK
jgi:hypothetical protein